MVLTTRPCFASIAYRPTALPLGHLEEKPMKHIDITIRVWGCRVRIKLTW